MKKLAALILGSALTVLSAGYALATSAPTTDTSAAQPAKVAAPAAPAATATTPTAAPAASPAPAAAEAKDQAPKIGYVDMTQVAADTDRGKAATASLKSRSEKLSAKIQAKQKQIEKQKAAIEAKLETLSPKERAAKSKEFQKKLEEYQKLVRSSDQEMQEMQEKLTTELFQVIKKAAAEYGKANGYAAILTKKELLYLADVPAPKELTEEIVEMMNKKPAAK